MVVRLSLSPDLRMLLRRGTIATAVLVTIGLSALAGLIASRDYAAMEREVIARVERETGAALRFASRRQTLWPKPKIVFDSLSFSRADPGNKSQDIVVKAPQAILNFDLFDLIDGRIDGPSITLIRPEIEVAVGHLDAHLRSPRAITDIIDRFAGFFDGQTGFNRLRLELQQARLTFRGGMPDGGPLEMTPVDAKLRFSTSKGRIDLSARQNSPNRPLEFSASIPTRKVLDQDKTRAASFHVSGYDSRLSFAGTARRDPDMAMIGRLEVDVGKALEAIVLGETVNRRQSALQITSLSANVTLDPRGVGLDSLKISRAAKQLAGIAALREINGRWGVSATLAGDLVDGTAAYAAFQNTRTSEGAWSPKPLAINPLVGIDLDIRFSTKEFKLGKVSLSNVALSILTRQGRAELAIVDSRFGNGIVKARVSLADAPGGGQDLRVMASGERVEMGSLLERALGFNRLSGEGNIVLQVEGRGTSVAALASSLSGTGALEVRGGELSGIDLQRLLARSTDGRPDAALIFSLAGKTSFENLQVNFAVQDGRIEPVGSRFISPRVTAMLEGAIDLGAQRHQLAIVLKRRVDEPGKPGEFYAFRLDGPLFSPSLKPDLKLLLNRS